MGWLETALKQRISGLVLGVKYLFLWEQSQYGFIVFKLLTLLGKDKWH